MIPIFTWSFWYLPARWLRRCWCGVDYTEILEPVSDVSSVDEIQSKFEPDTVTGDLTKNDYLDHSPHEHEVGESGVQNLCSNINGAYESYKHDPDNGFINEPYNTDLMEFTKF